MIIEFWGYDEELRIYTAIPFSIGLFFIAVYYLIILPKEKSRLASIPVSAPDHKWFAKF